MTITDDLKAIRERINWLAEGFGTRFPRSEIAKHIHETLPMLDAVIAGQHVNDKSVVSMPQTEDESGSNTGHPQLLAIETPMGVTGAGEKGSTPGGLPSPALGVERPVFTKTGNDPNDGMVLLPPRGSGSISFASEQPDEPPPHYSGPPEWQRTGSSEVPYRLAEYKEALTAIMQACKREMKKTQGSPWRTLDRINRIAFQQLVMMRTPIKKD